MNHIPISMPIYAKNYITGLGPFTNETLNTFWFLFKKTHTQKWASPLYNPTPTLKPYTLLSPSAPPPVCTAAAAFTIWAWGTTKLSLLWSIASLFFSPFLLSMRDVHKYVNLYMYFLRFFLVHIKRMWNLCLSVAYEFVVVCWIRAFVFSFENPFDSLYWKLVSSICVTGSL